MQILFKNLICSPIKEITLIPQPVNLNINRLKLNNSLLNNVKVNVSVNQYLNISLHCLLDRCVLECVGLRQSQLTEEKKILQNYLTQSLTILAKSHY